MPGNNLPALTETVPGRYLRNLPAAYIAGRYLGTLPAPETGNR